MNKHHLHATPAGLRTLLEQSPRATAHGEFGFVSTELALADATAAHELRALLQELYQAAAQVHGKLHVLRGKRARQDFASLTGALDRARSWV